MHLWCLVVAAGESVVHHSHRQHTSLALGQIVPLSPLGAALMICSGDALPSKWLSQDFLQL